MNHAFVLVGNDRLRDSLIGQLKDFSFDVRSYQLRGAEDVPGGDSESIAGWVSDEFNTIEAWLERQIMEIGGSSKIRSALGIIDFADLNCEGWHEVNPLRTSRQPLVALATMIILMIPEVHWVLNTTYIASPSDSLTETADFSNYHIYNIELSRLIQLHKTGFVPMFDPTGLRQVLKRALWRGSIGGTPPFPSRNELAASIDEESSYSLFNALVAYRLGYRTWCVSSWRLLRHLFGSSQQETFSMIFEDLYLNFSDRVPMADLAGILAERRNEMGNDHHQFSNLEFRDHLLPSLCLARNRVIVTSGSARTSAQQRKWRENLHYLCENRVYFDWLRRCLAKIGIVKTAWAEDRIFSVVLKPIAGMHRLMRDCGRWNQSWLPWRNAPKFSEKFAWPPLWHYTDETEDVGHSAPGRILLVAESLIRRSRELANNCTCTEDAIQGAVLALEAKELLAGLTPTTTLEAIGLQHECEVMAESMFTGVQQNISVKDRLREIASETKEVCRWFRSGVLGQWLGRSSADARITIVEQLAKRFRERGQIEEELECLAHCRYLRVKFWLSEQPCNPIRIIAFPFFWYGSWCLSRFRNLIIAVAVVIMLFGFAYAAIDLPTGVEVVEDTHRLSSIITRSYTEGWIGLSANFFFTLSPLKKLSDLADTCPVAVVTQSLQAICSFFHLGLLISHLYLAVSRR